MKLLMIIPTLSSGGAERVITEMANYWCIKGWEITLITLSGGQEADFYKLESGVKRLLVDVNGESKLLGNFKRVKLLRSMMISEKPNIIISFIDVANILSLLARVGLKVPIIVSERIDPSINPDIRFQWALIRRVMYRFSNLVITQTDNAKDWIKKKCNAYAIALPNPLRALEATPSLTRKNIILSIGRLTHQKGFDVLIKSFSDIIENVGGWELIILGEGEERENLENYIDHLELNKSVTLVGRVKDVGLYIQTAGIVVQASRYEGFPNAVLESMGYGSPVISSDCLSGPSEMISDGINGFLFPVDDNKKLSEIMYQLIADSELRARIGVRAKEVNSRFEQCVVMERWEKEINNLLLK
jgi:glycosyltransferase involved in cell wall biosynthesis